jgi:ComF family protein
LKTQPQLPRKLADLLVTTYDRNGFADASLLIPVPLSKQRQLERGFNQADVIASALSKATGVRVDPLSLVRTKHSPIHRAGMDEKARDLSVQKSFSVKRAKLIRDQKVLLIDDVLTTGATASYCAQALKDAGAAQVNVLTLARAV